MSMTKNLWTFSKYCVT